jgi:hypothetical protein
MILNPKEIREWDTISGTVVQFLNKLRQPAETLPHDPFQDLLVRVGPGHANYLPYVKVGVRKTANQRKSNPSQSRSNTSKPPNASLCGVPKLWISSTLPNEVQTSNFV